MVSTWKRRALIALLWAAAAVFCFLIWWSPPFRHVMGALQWSFGAVTGWLAHQGWQASRNRIAAKREVVRGQTIIKFPHAITEEQAAEFRERLEALYRKPGR
jgi:hypothetical protein